MVRRAAWIDASELDQRVAVQLKVEEKDQYGRLGVASWNTGSTVWAQVRAIRGTELAEARQIEARVTHKVVMRRMLINSKMRLLLEDGTILNISEAIIETDRRGDKMELMCIEVQG